MLARKWTKPSTFADPGNFQVRSKLPAFEMQEEILRAVTANQVQGYLAHKKHPPLLYNYRFLGTGLLWGPTGGNFLMLEVTL